MKSQKTTESTITKPIKAVWEEVEHISSSGQVPDVVPSGWFSITQMADKWKCSESSARRKMMLAYERGLLEKRVYRVMQINKISQVLFFRPKKGK